MRARRPQSAAARRPSADASAAGIARRSAYDDFVPPSQTADADINILQEQMLVRDKKRLEEQLVAERRRVGDLQNEVQSLVSRVQGLADELGAARGAHARREWAAKQDKLRAEGSKGEQTLLAETSDLSPLRKEQTDAWQQELAPAIRSVLQYGGAGDVVAATLDLMEVMMNPRECLARAQEWCRRRAAAARRAEDKQSRFSDAPGCAAGAVSTGALLPVSELFPSTFRSSGPWQALRAMHSWRPLRGECWERDEIDVLTHDSAVWCMRHSEGHPAEVVAPLYVYTAEVQRRVVWAVWVPRLRVWQQLPAPAAASQEAEHAKLASGGDALVLKRSVRTAVAWMLPCPAEEVPAALLRHGKTWQGVSAFAGGDEPLYVARYVNPDARDGELAKGRRASSQRPGLAQSTLLWGASLWLCPPDAAFARPPTTFAFSDDVATGLPPPTVFEYLSARRWDEEQDFSSTGWGASPYELPDGLKEFAAKASAAPNRQRVAAGFKDALADGGLPGAAVRTVAIAAGIPTHAPHQHGCGFDVLAPEPTFGDAAAALELQTVTWHSRELYVCLSGKRCSVGDRAMGGASSIHRARIATPVQPQPVIDEAVGAACSGDTLTFVDVEDTAASHVRGRYLPTEYAPRAYRGTAARRGPVRMQREARGSDCAPQTEIVWNPEQCCWDGPDVRIAEEDVVVHQGQWMLGGSRPVLFYLHKAVEALPVAVGVVRRAAPQALRELLSDDRLTRVPFRWPAFATAAGKCSHAEMPGGHAMLIRSTTARVLGGLSRWSRDLDWLFPAGTCFAPQGQLRAGDDVAVNELPVLSALAVCIRAELPTAAASDLARLLELARLLDTGAGEQAASALLKPSGSASVLLSPGGSLCVAQLVRLGLTVPESLDAALHGAAAGAWGDAKTSAQLCRLLLHCGAGCTSPDRDTGLPPAAVAARALNTESVAVLVAAGAPPPQKSDFGADALHRAGRTGRADAIEALLDRWGFKEDTVSRDNDGRCPLHYAAACPAFGTSDSERALRRLCQPSDELVAMELPAVPSNQAEHGYRALHLAAKAGLTNPIELLLSLGADADAQGCDGADPLRIACRCLRSDAIELLLSHASRPVRSEDFLPGALHRASAEGDLRAVQMLLRLCCTDPPERDDPRHQAEAPLGCPSGRLCGSETGLIGALPLHAACAVAAFDEAPNGPELLRQLCTPLSVNCRTPSGHTALHRAAFYGRPHSVAVLLQCGADPNVLSDASPPQTALDVAVAHGYAMCAARLVRGTQRPLATCTPEQLRDLVQWAGPAHPLRNAGEVRRMCSAAAAHQGERLSEETRRRLLWGDTKASVCGRTGQVRRVWSGVVELDFGGSVGKLCFPLAAVRRGEGEAPAPTQGQSPRRSLGAVRHSVSGLLPAGPKAEEPTGLWKRIGARKAVAALARFAESPAHARRSRVRKTQEQHDDDGELFAEWPEQGGEPKKLGWFGSSADQLLTSRDRPSFSSPPSSVALHSRARRRTKQRGSVRDLDIAVG